jgi:GAF domain-containing protein
MSQNIPGGDVSANRQPSSDSVSAIVEQVRQMVADGTPLRAALARLATAGERISGPGTAVSILVIDADGLLRNGASPNLPHDYLNAIDRLRPDARVGTCAAAAATGAAVLTPDFLADDKWSELRHLPLALGYAGAWSMPIKAADGTVLGTFGTYFRERREPTAWERQAVESLASAAAFVISACNSLADICGRPEAGNDRPLSA